jgi:hypothetical protein
MPERRRHEPAADPASSEAARRGEATDRPGPIRWLRDVLVQPLQVVPRLLRATLRATPPFTPRRETLEPAWLDRRAGDGDGPENDRGEAVSREPDRDHAAGERARSPADRRPLEDTVDEEQGRLAGEQTAGVETERWSQTSPRVGGDTSSAARDGADQQTEEHLAGDDYARPERGTPSEPSPQLEGGSQSGRASSAAAPSRQTGPKPLPATASRDAAPARRPERAVQPQAPASSDVAPRRVTSDMWPSLPELVPVVEPVGGDASHLARLAGEQEGR